MHIKRTIIKNNSDYSKKAQKIKIDKVLDSRAERYKLLSEDEVPGQRKYIFFKKNKAKQYRDLFLRIAIKIDSSSFYQHWIDVGCFFNSQDCVIENTSPKFDKIIDYSITDLKKEYKKSKNKDVYCLICFIEKYILRIISEMKKVKNPNERLKKSELYFERMLNCKAESLDEAYQRIIFWTSIFWQSGHTLVGLGRLDLILDSFSKTDEDQTIQLTCEFFQTIHKYYAFKSSPEAMGDTGQIIIIGGTSEDGSYFCNKLTYSFIKTLKQCHLPDPKLLLRVSKNTPDDLLCLALECISTGVGSPLLANDEKIIPAMIGFGYEKSDACNYVTSACWEPLSYGNSFEQNNLSVVNFASVFTETYDDSRFEKCNSFDEVVSLYKEKLANHADHIKDILNGYKWEPDPLLSLFIDNCENKDVSVGGAKYNNYGVLSVGMSNAINSLLYIKHNVFKENGNNLKSIKILLQNDYNDVGNDEELCMSSISSASHYFGHDSEETIELTNELIDVVNDCFSDYRNPLGGKVKWGLSSSTYKTSGAKTKATLDGRKATAPLGVHISGNDDVSPSELLNFSCLLNVSEVNSNGNVVDIIISPQLINNNFEKIKGMIKSSIELGFFEMQLNVVDSQTLIDAFYNPDKYPDLIVRVWGFSAFYNQLPNAYKVVLINRTLASEGKRADFAA